jgi:hypothetical protein
MTRGLQKTCGNEVQERVKKQISLRRFAVAHVFICGQGKNRTGLDIHTNIDLSTCFLVCQGARRSHDPAAGCRVQ